MSRSPTPRRHHHLKRETIARAALELIDLEGPAAFSMRKLAAALRVRANNLYPYIADKESLLRDIVALLVSEIDVDQQPAAGWEQCVISVGASLGEMALRHPRAFPLFALASNDDPALIHYERRLGHLFVAAGLPEDLLPRLTSMLDAYATGYLLLATQARTDSADDFDPGFDADEAGASLAAGVPDDLHEYEEGTRAIIAGFKIRNGLAAD